MDVQVLEEESKKYLFLKPYYLNYFYPTLLKTLRSVCILDEGKKHGLLN